MRNKKLHITIMILLLCVGMANSQESLKETSVDYHINSIFINPVNTDNAFVEAINPIIKGWIRKLHLKTNILALGMAITNVAAEIDLAKHWSFSLPVNYSAWDYFQTTSKFRTFDVRPQFRYWPSKNNDGFFTGAHFGIVSYNIAFDKEYRYQNQDNTPDIGGGISIGYRHPISKYNRWRVEYSLGAGVYQLNYNKYNNTPITKDGMMIESIKETYIGIDQAAISFSYSFDLSKEGVNK